MVPSSAPGTRPTISGLQLPRLVNHLRRETIARSIATMTRTYRAYAATLLGDYLDIRGQKSRRSDVYASDRYDASQKLGVEVRAGGSAGLLYKQPATPDREQRRSASAAQHRKHRTDRSFRNYGAGNVAHDRRPKTGALIELPTAGTVAVIVVAFCSVTFAATFRISLHLANVPLARQERTDPRVPGKRTPTSCEIGIG